MGSSTLSKMGEKNQERISSSEKQLGMGPSTLPKMSKEDRERRRRLEKQLHKMQRSLRVTAASHYLSSEHYENRDRKVVHASYLTGSLGSTGAGLFTLAWKKISAKYPRLAPIFAATSATFVLYTVVANSPLPNSPGTLAKLHFQSGIECQYLERRVQFFADCDVWNSEEPWSTLASKYENLLKEKKEVNSKIKSEEWAYHAALEKIEKREKEKRQKKEGM